MDIETAMDPVRDEVDGTKDTTMESDLPEEEKDSEVMVNTGTETPKPASPDEESQQQQQQLNGESSQTIIMDSFNSTTSASNNDKVDEEEKKGEEETEEREVESPSPSVLNHSENDSANDTLPSNDNDGTHSMVDVMSQPSVSDDTTPTTTQSNSIMMVDTSTTIPTTQSTSEPSQQDILDLQVKPEAPPPINQEQEEQETKEADTMHHPEAQQEEQPEHPMDLASPQQDQEELQSTSIQKDEEVEEEKEEEEETTKTDNMESSQEEEKEEVDSTPSQTEETDGSEPCADDDSVPQTPEKKEVSVPITPATESSTPATIETPASLTIQKGLSMFQNSSAAPLSPKPSVSTTIKPISPRPLANAAAPLFFSAQASTATANAQKKTLSIQEELALLRGKSLAKTFAKDLQNAGPVTLSTEDTTEFATRQKKQKQQWDQQQMESKNNLTNFRLGTLQQEEDPNHNSLGQLSETNEEHDSKPVLDVNSFYMQQSQRNKDWKQKQREASHMLHAFGTKGAAESASREEDDEAEPQEDNEGSQTSNETKESPSQKVSSPSSEEKHNSLGQLFETNKVDDSKPVLDINSFYMQQSQRNKNWKQKQREASHMLHAFGTKGAAVESASQDGQDEAEPQDGGAQTTDENEDNLPREDEIMSPHAPDEEQQEETEKQEKEEAPVHEEIEQQEEQDEEAVELSVESGHKDLEEQQPDQHVAPNEKDADNSVDVHQQAEMTTNQQEDKNNEQDQNIQTVDDQQEAPVNEQVDLADQQNENVIETEEELPVEATSEETEIAKQEVPQENETDEKETEIKEEIDGPKSQDEPQEEEEKEADNEQKSDHAVTDDAQVGSLEDPDSKAVEKSQDVKEDNLTQEEEVNEADVQEENLERAEAEAPAVDPQEKDDLSQQNTLETSTETPSLLEEESRQEPNPNEGSDAPNLGATEESPIAENEAEDKENKPNEVPDVNEDDVPPTEIAKQEDNENVEDVDASAEGVKGDDKEASDDKVTEDSDLAASTSPGNESQEQDISASNLESEVEGKQSDVKATTATETVANEVAKDDDDEQTQPVQDLEAMVETDDEPIFGDDEEDAAPIAKEPIDSAGLSSKELDDILDPNKEKAAGSAKPTKPSVTIVENAQTPTKTTKPKRQPTRPGLKTSMSERSVLRKKKTSPCTPTTPKSTTSKPTTRRMPGYMKSTRSSSKLQVPPDDEQPKSAKKQPSSATKLPRVARMSSPMKARKRPETEQKQTTAKPKPFSPKPVRKPVTAASAVSAKRTASTPRLRPINARTTAPKQPDKRTASTPRPRTINVRTTIPKQPVSNARVRAKSSSRATNPSRAASPKVPRVATLSTQRQRTNVAKRPEAVKPLSPKSSSTKPTKNPADLYFKSVKSSGYGQTSKKDQTTTHDCESSVQSVKSNQSIKSTQSIKSAHSIKSGHGKTLSSSNLSIASIESGSSKSMHRKDLPLFARSNALLSEKRRCKNAWVVDLHGTREGCERCLFYASDAAKKRYYSVGHHFSINMVRGGCPRDCKLFPRDDNERPVRLCRKCFSDTHRTGRNQSNQK